MDFDTHYQIVTNFPQLGGKNKVPLFANKKLHPMEDKVSNKK